MIKRDGARVPYDRNKILAGLQRACYKRPILEEQLYQVIDSVEDEIFQNYDREIDSHIIGSLVVERLRDIDQIAYVRFASVYRQFHDLGELIDEAKEVMYRTKQHSPGQQNLYE